MLSKNESIPIKSDRCFEEEKISIFVDLLDFRKRGSKIRAKRGQKPITFDRHIRCTIVPILNNKRIESCNKRKKKDIYFSVVVMHADRKHLHVDAGGQQYVPSILRRCRCLLETR